jgi:hypothetical protein
MRKILAAMALVLLVGCALSGCSPKVGSEAWCKAMKDKPKGDWTANETADFARHCIFRKQ